MNYKLTVITSTYNVGEEFHRTADSILSQKNNIQWIVCDGGSNEFSLSIINKFKRDIDILIIEKDEGICPQPELVTISTIFFLNSLLIFFLIKF